MQQQEQLSLRRADCTAHIQMDSVNSESIKYYYNLLETTLDKNNLHNTSGQIYWVPLDPRPPNIIAQSGQKKVRYRQSGKKEQVHISSQMIWSQFFLMEHCTCAAFMFTDTHVLMNTHVYVPTWRARYCLFSEVMHTICSRFQLAISVPAVESNSIMKNKNTDLIICIDLWLVVVEQEIIWLLSDINMLKVYSGQ